MDLVSIIIPTYNTLSNYLTDCLDSCLNQTHSNLEILVVDDNSNDPTTLSLLQEYAQRDPRIHVIYQKENHGQANSRNIAIDMCHGKYFTMIDHDDLLCPDFIERCVAALHQTSADFAMSHIVTFRDSDNASCDSVEQMLVEHRKSYGDPVPSNDKHDKWNLFGRDNSVLSLKLITTMGRLFYLPAAVYGKVFDTQKYKDAGMRLDPSEEMRNVEDEDWLMNVALKLNNFVLLDFYGVKHRISITAASTGSARYYQQSLNAAVRRYELLGNAGVGALYYNAILKHALECVSRICGFTSKQAERNQQWALMQPKLAKLFYPLCPHQGSYDVGFNYNLSQVYKCLYPQAPHAIFVSQTNINCNLELKQRLESFAYQGLRIEGITLTFNRQPQMVTPLNQIYQILLKSLPEEQHKHFLSYPLNSIQDNGVTYHIIKDANFITHGLCTPNIEPEQVTGSINLILEINKRSPLQLCLVDKDDEWAHEIIKQTNLNLPVIELDAQSQLQEVLAPYPEFLPYLNLGEPPMVSTEELSQAKTAFEGPNSIELLPS